VGFEKTLLVNTGTTETPTWTEIDLAKDVTVTKEKGEINATSRVTARQGWEATEEGLKKFSVDFDSLQPAPDEAVNPAYAALDAAFLANSTVDVCVADGAISGTAVPAIRVQCGVFGGTESEPLNDMVTVKFSLKAKSAPVYGTFTSGTFSSTSSSSSSSSSSST
jgi:hypothetical protein